MGSHSSVPGPASHSTLFCPQILPQPATDSRPHGLLYHWLHRLQKAPQKVSYPGGGWMPGLWIRKEADAWAMGNHVLISLTGVSRMPSMHCHIQPLPAPHTGPELCSQGRSVCLRTWTHPQLIWEPRPYLSTKPHPCLISLHPLFMELQP